MSSVRSVVLVDAVRTPFGKAGSMYAGTRADDLMVRAMRGLLERNPKVDPAAIDDVAIAAATHLAGVSRLAHRRLLVFRRFGSSH